MGRGAVVELMKEHANFMCHLLCSTSQKKSGSPAIPVPHREASHRSSGISWTFELKTLGVKGTCVLFCKQTFSFVDPAVVCILFVRHFQPFYTHYGRNNNSSISKHYLVAHVSTHTTQQVVSVPAQFLLSYHHLGLVASAKWWL